MSSDICECGNIAEAQGYCRKCLSEYEIHLSNEVKVEEFIRAGEQPRTLEDLETEKAITESLEQEPVIDQKTITYTQPRGQIMTEITDVAVYPYNGGGTLKAFANVTLNNDFVVKGIRLIEGKNGLFLGFPENRKGDVNYPICNPITASLRKNITDEVISTWDAREEVKQEEEVPVEA